MKLTSTIETLPSGQDMCQIEVWGPPQGALKEAFPLSMDLDFSSEQVVLPTTTFSVSAARATLYVRTMDAKIVRGSRLGEHALDPYMVEEVTQSVRVAIESELDAGGSVEVTVQPGLFGKLMGYVRWRKRKSQKSERDHIVKTATRVSRISPRPNSKWDVVEPVAPYLLKGRYIGVAGQLEIGPLCLLTMEKTSCIIDIKVAVKRQDIAIGGITVLGVPVLDRNRKLVLDQIARRSIEPNHAPTLGSTLQFDPNSIILCSSKMEVRVENEQ